MMQSVMQSRQRKAGAFGVMVKRRVRGRRLGVRRGCQWRGGMGHVRGGDMGRGRDGSLARSGAVEAQVMVDATGFRHFAESSQDAVASMGARVGPARVVGCGDGGEKSDPDAGAANRRHTTGMTRAGRISLTLGLARKLDACNEGQPCSPRAPRRDPRTPGCRGRPASSRWRRHWSQLPRPPPPTRPNRCAAANSGKSSQGRLATTCLRRS